MRVQFEKVRLIMLDDSDRDCGNRLFCSMCVRVFVALQTAPDEYAYRRGMFDPERAPRCVIHAR